MRASRVTHLQLFCEYYHQGHLQIGLDGLDCRRIGLDSRLRGNDKEKEWGHEWLRRRHQSLKKQP